MSPREEERTIKMRITSTKEEKMQRREKQRKSRVGDRNRTSSGNMHPITKIVQWNCKGLGARHEDVRLDINLAGEQ